MKKYSILILFTLSVSTLFAQNSNATIDPMYMHEYGHTIDSRLFDLFAIGIPSAISANNSKSVIDQPYSTHDIYGTELRANRRAKKYFSKYYGINWNYPTYPLNK